MNIKFSVLCFGSGAKGVVPDETLVSSANASSSNQESHDVGMYTSCFPMLELLHCFSEYVFLHT